MFGVVVEVAIEQGRGEEAQKMLTGTVVPMVKALPGLVSGHWLQSDDGLTGVSFLLFETEEQARSAASSAPQPPPGSGVTVKRFEAMRISAQA